MERSFKWWALPILILAAAAFALPLVSALSLSFTPSRDLFLGGIHLLPPDPTLSNFSQALHQEPIFRWYANSITVSVLFTVGQIASCSLTAFGLVWIRTRLSGILFAIVLVTMMLPFQSIMIPLFEVMKTLHLLNQDASLWVPAFFGDITGAFNVFLMRQAFLQVPKELGDAAKIDGCGAFGVFWHTYLPNTVPYLAVVTVFSFLNSWNDFIRPIVYITSVSRMTVTGGLSFFQSQWNVEWGPLMAGTVLAILPTLVLYLFTQKYMVEIASSSGIKG